MSPMARSIYLKEEVASVPPGHPINLPNVKATESLGAWIGALLRPGDFVALTGDLGSGKTSLARGLIEDLLAQAGAPLEHVQSPTFNLVQPYSAGALEIWHYDLYRIDSAQELEELGLDEALDVGCVICEWPDRLGALLPGDRLDVALELASTARRATLHAHGDFEARLDTAWQGSPFQVRDNA